MIIIDIDKQGQNGTTIFNILDNTTELWMTKYIIGEIFSSGGATLYKNPSDQTVRSFDFQSEFNFRIFQQWKKNVKTLIYVSKRQVFCNKAFVVVNFEIVFLYGLLHFIKEETL